MRFAIVFSASMLAAPAAYACSCAQTNAIEAVQTNDFALIGKVVRETTSGNNRLFVVKVSRDYKGGLAGERVKVYTSMSSASCGVSLVVGQRYFIEGMDHGVAGNGRQKVYTSLCDYTLLKSQLTSDDKAYLRDRYNSVTQTCMSVKNPYPVSCLADPCSMSTPCANNLTCEANYCGGCTAEYYNAYGQAECTPW
jgi:hypothetical protein